MTSSTRFRAAQPRYSVIVYKLFIKSYSRSVNCTRAINCQLEASERARVHLERELSSCRVKDRVQCRWAARRRTPKRWFINSSCAKWRTRWCPKRSKRSGSEGWRRARQVREQRGKKLTTSSSSCKKISFEPSTWCGWELIVVDLISVHGGQVPVAYVTTTKRR